MKPLRELGTHSDGGAVAVYEGRYGPYVKWEKVNATLPKETAPEAVPLDEALALIAAKAPKKRTARKPAAKATKAKAGAKKASTARPKAKAAKAAAKASE